MQDRVALARYVVTGELPPFQSAGLGSSSAVGSITMFGSDPPNINPREDEEVFLHAVPLAKHLLPHAPAGAGVMDEALSFVRGGLQRLRDALASGLLIVDVRHALLSPADANLHEYIATKLAPSSMSWSNVCDYMPARQFHAMAAACSAAGASAEGRPGTLHILHAMNWVHQVSKACTLNVTGWARNFMLRACTVLNTPLLTSRLPACHAARTGVGPQRHRAACGQARAGL